jgi:hypothetical protein
VWIIPIYYARVLYSAELEDFFTTGNGNLDKFFLENSNATIKKLLSLLPMTANAKQVRFFANKRTENLGITALQQIDA